MQRNIERDVARYSRILIDVERDPRAMSSREESIDLCHCKMLKDIERDTEIHREISRSGEISSRAPRHRNIPRRGRSKDARECDRC